MMMRRRWMNRVVTLLAVVFSYGCGDSDPSGPDPLVAPFVGDWSATALVLTSPLADLISVDIIEIGSTFDLNVQPSGAYTAILVFAGGGSVEIGTIEVTATTITLHRDFPNNQTAVSTYQFIGDDMLILDGETEFDFNLDGIQDQAIAHFELARK
jgi:hypothetical protein